MVGTKKGPNPVNERISPSTFRGRGERRPDLRGGSYAIFNERIVLRTARDLVSIETERLFKVDVTTSNGSRPVST